jgi:hypothetical protein
MKDVRNLIVGRRAHQLTLEIYRSTARFQGDERVGLTIQRGWRLSL